MASSAWRRSRSSRSHEHTPSLSLSRLRSTQQPHKCNTQDMLRGCEAAQDLAGPGKAGWEESKSWGLDGLCVWPPGRGRLPAAECQQLACYSTLTCAGLQAVLVSQNTRPWGSVCLQQNTNSV